MAIARPMPLDAPVISTDDMVGLRVRELVISGQRTSVGGMA
jgi:hypothetical protein